MKLKNILSCFLLLIGLVGNILALDKEEEKTYIPLSTLSLEIQDLVTEENWNSTEIKGFFYKGGSAKWDNEFGASSKEICNKLALGRYEYLTLTGKVGYMGDGFERLGGLNLSSLKILDLDFYFSIFNKKQLDDFQKSIEEIFKGKRGLTVIFRMCDKISRTFIIG